MSLSESSTKVCDWLAELRLEQYADAFQRAGLVTVQQCCNLTTEQLRQMGIHLPGHQKRILSSLSKTPSLSSKLGILEQLSNDEVSQKDCPVKEQLENEKSGKETTNLNSNDKMKPIPKKRQVVNIPKDTQESERKPVIQQRHTTPGEEKGEKSNGGVNVIASPVPRERTKLSASALATSSPNSDPVSMVSDSFLPPVPPRSTLNCPPQRFTSPLSRSPPAQTSSAPKSDGHLVKPPATPCRTVSPNSTPVRAALQPPPVQSAPARPQTLAIQPGAQRLNDDGGGKASPISHFASPLEDKNVPPLPPKAGGGCKSPPPIPQRCLMPSPSKSLNSTNAGTDMQEDCTPQIPPRTKTTQSQENNERTAQPDTQPPLPARRIPHSGSLGSILDNSDYEDPDFSQPSVQQKNDVTLRVPGRLKNDCSSLYSDDDMLADEDNGNFQWNEMVGFNTLTGSVDLSFSGRFPGFDKEDSSQHSVIIKMGWLDKNPPQGALYYQRRWVVLDVDYLRYFDNEKETYSKGLISTDVITNVASVGELKFEVVTSNRTFIFRAENEAERSSWVSALQDCTRGRQRRSILNAGSAYVSDCRGYLELRGLRSKLYTVVCSDKVFLYKNLDDYRIGVGITAINMNVGNVKVTDRRSFDLTTPYRIFSFIADTEQLRDQWVNAMRDSIGEALSNSEIVEKIWENPSNCLCADCGAPKPDWASINLCVVICKRCAGEHRGLGPSVSKVRSLKMDKKVWTEELIKIFQLLGNEQVNSFWAANTPPSEALTQYSCDDDRRRFITNKYRQGKYRKYHPLSCNQQELNNALVINVQCSDVLETLSLIFCGADVNCSTGMEEYPTPLALATARSQTLQAELIRNNLCTDLPQSVVNVEMDLSHYQPPSCVSLNGFLYKTGSMTRAVTERKAKEEFSRRWCTLNDGIFSYYESDKNANPNGTLKSSEIVCLAVDVHEKHGYEYTFELYSEAERLYLFGTDDPDTHKEWIKSIAKSFIPAHADPLLKLGFERIGQLKCKDGLNLQTSKVGWFALVGSTLHAYLDGDKGEEIQLRKLNELSIQQDNEVLVLVERGRTLYIEGERKLDFAGWCSAIQGAAGSGGDTLSQQQLTETDIPVIVHSCIDYITQCGLTSEGIYRKSGVNSRVKALCERFRHDARSLRLKDGENQVDDVSNTLKRFFRELEEGLFTFEYSKDWLSAVGIRDEEAKLFQYKYLLNKLPKINKATLQALINHLYCVQRFSDHNQMNLHNLAIVFGPTLFQTDGKDYTAGRAIEDLIEHYTEIFEVDEHQLNKQLEVINTIIKMRDKLSTKFPTHQRTETDGHFICTVYLEEKKATAEQLVKVPGSMTAAELTCEILDRRNIPVKAKDYWSCWEVCEKEEMERPLHYQERVLLIFHSAGTDSYLLIKKHPAMDGMIFYLSGRADVSKSGVIKFREERSILGLGLPSGNFHEKYFILNSNSLRMYKDVRSNRPDREWQVKNLIVYLGIKKKLRAPTCWGLTVVYESKKQEKPERQQWYLCFETQSEMKEWYATFLSIQYDGDLWPQDGLQRARASRMVLDARHNNVSLIPLRGSENEMRNSVAAFSQDPLALFRDVR